MTAVVVLIIGVCGWLTLRIPYHKWRLAVCRATAERLRTGQNTRMDEMWALVRGTPKTATEYYEASMRHEDALIRFKHLARKEFRLRNPLSSNEAIDRFSAVAAKRFPNTREWWCVFSASGDSVVITTEPKRMAEWEQFIRQYDAVKTSKTYRKCKWRRRSIDAVRAVRF